MGLLVHGRREIAMEVSVALYSNVPKEKSL